MTETNSSMVTTDPRQATPQFFARSHEVVPGLLLRASFVNTYPVQTEAGLLLVGPGFRRNSESVYTAVRVWSETALHTAISPPGYMDHAFGL